MRRREFIRNSAVVATLSMVNVPKGFFVDQDMIKFKIGKIGCTVFRDSMFKYLAKDFFTNANQEELTPSLNKYNIPTGDIPSPFIALLLQYDDKKVLIDTGVGFTEKPIMVRGNPVTFNGKLQQLLQKEKIKKEDISDVVITHFHPDHIGGIFSEDEQLNFPNARFHMHADEWNYWHSSQADNQPDQFKYFIKKNITKLKDGNLNLITGDFVTLMPGLTSIKAEGHTPGQITLGIHSEKDHLLYISDAFLHPLHMEHLDWQTNYDLDHDKAKQSRTKLLDLAHKENMLINAFHFDFPGLGRIEKHDNSWVWTYSRK